MLGPAWDHRLGADSLWVRELLEEEVEKLRYDLYYLKHMSFWLDLKILFESVNIVFSGHGVADVDARRTPRRERTSQRASAGLPDAVKADILRF